MRLSKFISFFNSILNILLPLFRLPATLFPYKSDSVLIIALHKLGDTVFSMPTISEFIKEKSNVYLVCYPECRPILELKFSCKIITINKDEIYFGQRLAGFSARKKLKKIKPNQILDITGSVASATLIFGLRSKTVIGANTNSFKAIYTNYFEQQELNNQFNFYRSYLGKEEFTEEELNRFFAENLSGENIFLHPYAGWAAKEWNPDNFIELFQRLKSNGEKVFILADSNESFNYLKQLNLAQIIYTETVQDLIEKIKNAKLFIGNDSGPVNIAKLIGVPTITLYGPTNPIFHHLDSWQHQYIEKRVHCSPAINKKFCHTFAGRVGCDDFICMKNIDVDSVFDEAQKLLAEIELKRVG